MSRLRPAITALMLATGLSPALAVTSATPTSNAPPTVAVLNFSNRAIGPEGERWSWLGKGLADLLITDLATDPSLVVVSRNRMQLLMSELEQQAAGAYDVDPERAAKAARMLAATRVLTGSFEVRDGQVRIDVVLTDARNGDRLSAWQVSGDVETVLDLERKLARGLLEHLAGRGDRDALERMLPRWTDSLSAAEHLYRGIDEWDHGRFEEGWLEFRRAVKQDAQYADAHFWIGRMLYFLDYFEHARQTHHQFVEAFASHPRSGDAVVEYAHTFEMLGAPPETLRRVYRELLELQPEGEIYNVDGFRDRTGFAAERVPASFWIATRLAVTELIAAEYERVLETVQPMRAARMGPFGSLALEATRRHFLETGRWLDISSFEVDSDSITEILPRGRRRLLEPGTDEIRLPLVYAEKGEYPRRGHPHPVFSTGEVRLVAPDEHLITAVSLKVDAPAGASVRNYFVNYHSAVTKARDRYEHRYEYPNGVAEAGGGQIVLVYYEAVPRLAGHFVDLKVELVRVGRPAVLHIDRNGISARIVAETADGTELMPHLGEGWPGSGETFTLRPGRHDLIVKPAYPSPGRRQIVELDVKSGEVVEIDYLPGDNAAPPGSTMRYLGVDVASPLSIAGTLRDTLRRREVSNEIYDLLEDRDGRIHLVGNRDGDIWIASKEPGRPWDPARPLGLPISSAYKEAGPVLVQGANGRFVLALVSDRNARHDPAVYISASEDLVRWTNPVLVPDIPGVSFSTKIALAQSPHGEWLLAAATQLPREAARPGYGTVLELRSSRDLGQWSPVATPSFSLVPPGSGRIRGYGSIHGHSVVHDGDRWHCAWAQQISYVHDESIAPEKRNHRNVPVEWKLLHSVLDGDGWTPPQSFLLSIKTDSNKMPQQVGMLQALWTAGDDLRALWSGNTTGLTTGRILNGRLEAERAGLQLPKTIRRQYTTLLADGSERLWAAGRGMVWGVDATFDPAIEERLAAPEPSERRNVMTLAAPGSSGARSHDSTGIPVFPLPREALPTTLAGLVALLFLVRLRRSRSHR